MTLGEKLKKSRTEKGFSQEKIAELIGVSRQAVTKWEGNQSTPSSENLLALASIYGISLDELVTDKQNEQKKENKILQSNLTLIAIILQLSCVNIAMQPFQITEVESLRILDLAIKIIPLFAASVWMAFNLRYEKNMVQYKKNTKIELLYCCALALIMLFGRYSKLYFVATLSLILVGVVYILVINPKYMNRRLTRNGKSRGSV